MSQFLTDILEQPVVLRDVLRAMHTTHADALRAAQDEIARTDRIVFTSMGSALYSCMPIAHALAQRHANVHVIETADLLSGSAAQHAGTLYVIVSRSGESGEVAAFAPLVRAGGGRLLVITMTLTSTIARHADVVLHDPAPFDGLICTKAFTSLILVGLLAVVPELNVKSLDASFAWLQANAQRLRECVAGVAWLNANHALSGITFLSQGAGMALALAGEMWTEEAARVRAAAMSMGNFHHGPVEQVDDDFHGVWIDLAPTARSRELQRELIGRGGHLITIAPAGEYGDADPRDLITLPLADLDEACRVIVAALPVQLIAERVAAMRGISAGEMRYLSWLVK